MTQIKGAVGCVTAIDVHIRHGDHPRAIARLQYVVRTTYAFWFNSVNTPSTADDSCE
jgi:hypothetical protein